MRSIFNPKFIKNIALIILSTAISTQTVSGQENQPQNLAGLNPFVYNSPISIQIPKPRIYFQEKGIFNPSATLYYYADPHLTNLAPEALQQLTNALDEFISYTSPKGISIVPTNNIKKAKIQILLLNPLRDPNNISLPTVEEQGYTMNVSAKNITIKLGGIPAIFNIIGNMQQWIYYYTDIAPSLFPDQTSYPLNCFSLRDYPEYAYRGMHLDISRHFFRQEHIFQYLDMMAMYKFNVLHLHLSDDQGWRLEIPQYPKLQTIAAYRNGSQVGPYRNQTYDSTLYGGFLTRNNIKNIVNKAKQLGITLIPEIEMPGHALAALTAYPELSCNGGFISASADNTGNLNNTIKPFEVAKGWGVFDDVFCAGNEKTFEFLQTVIDNVVELFPNSPYIHIGGDECPKTRWKTCSKCQKRIQDEHLTDEHELQSYFIKRIEKYVNAKGKKIIGWDEILEGGLAPDATVMSWRGELGGIAAAEQKHNAIMTPGKPLYFDHYQSKDSTEPHAIGGYNPLDLVYDYAPTNEQMPDSVKQYILGAQANVWTEYMTTWEHVQYMTTPRMQALSEALWLPDYQKNFNLFLGRLNLHQTLWYYYGIKSWGNHYLSH